MSGINKKLLYEKFVDQIINFTNELIKLFPNDNQDYIGDNIMIDNTINNTNNQYNRLDDFYNNLQTPLLLALLYFIFQLPIIKKYLFKFLPNLFGKDGNQNIYGHILF